MMEECDMELINCKKTTPRCFNPVVGKAVVKMKSKESYDYFFCEEHKQLAEKTRGRKNLIDKYGMEIPIDSVKLFRAVTLNELRIKRRKPSIATSCNTVGEDTDIYE